MPTGTPTEFDSERQSIIKKVCTETPTTFGVSDSVTCGPDRSCIANNQKCVQAVEKRRKEYEAKLTQALGEATNTGV